MPRATLRTAVIGALSRNTLAPLNDRPNFERFWFAGLALEGATLRQDLDDNATLYGKRLENREIVTRGVRPPKSAAKLIALLNQHSPREEKRASAK